MPLLEESSAASRELSLEQLTNLQNSYGEFLPRHRALLDEVGFILEERIQAAGIKIHGIEKRVKDLDSALSKCKLKHFENLNSLGDIVGARVVCLFRSDMKRVHNFTPLGLLRKRRPASTTADRRIQK